MAICCSKNQLLSACSSNLQFRLSIELRIPKAKVETANSEFDFQLNPIFFSQNRKAETKNEVEFRNLEASIASFQSRFCLRLTFGGHIFDFEKISKAQMELLTAIIPIPA